MKRRISFHVETPSSLSVWVDPHKVERVVLYLLSNAFKFTPEGGEICCLLQGDSRQSDRSGESREWFAIEDSGPGVPDSLRDSIFDRFSQIEGGTTRRFGGTALGLAIVKEFVELHGGTVPVTDAPSGGALFTVELPWLDPLEEVLPTFSNPDVNEIAAAEIAELSYPDAAIETLVLKNGDNSQPLLPIVEDYLEMNRFLCDSLGSEYRITMAFNGKRGLDLAVSLRPDLTIGDVMMPVLSGDRLVECLRTYPELNHTPIIMLTAKTDDELRVRLLREGVQDYLMKPFSVEELQARSRNPISMQRVRNVLQQELQTHTQNLEVLAHELASSKRDLQSALSREQQQTEELTRANRVKDEFLSIVSHELRTPLNSILGWTQLLRSRQMNPEKVDRALETIERNARQQVSPIDDILNVSCIVRGKVRLNPLPLQLERVVEAAIATVSPTAEAKQIQIGYTCAPTLSRILGDPDRLGQIVWYLLSNAVKFTPHGGRIDVAIAQSHSLITLQVRDPGIGISPEFLPHIFEGFRQADSSTTRAFGGLGLGLTIVRCLVELHGGTVEAWSEGLDKGATFTVTFPVLAQSPEEYPPDPDFDSQEGFSNQLWSLDGLQVLLVDDDLDTGELVATVLTQYGVQVRVATSAAEAIALIEQFPPDILVSDIGLPGQDGYGLIRQLRQLETERGSQIPAIALSAFTREEDPAKALLAGFQLHVAKPVEPAKLARILAQFAAQISKIDG